MHPRLFNLLEKRQRIDELLHLARIRADGSEIHRLLRLKTKAKRLIARFFARRAFPTRTCPQG